MLIRALRVALFAYVALSTACSRHGFDPASFTSTDALFTASMSHYDRRNWSEAARGFERLTNQLPARDPRLPTAYYFLGKSQQRMREHLTAAQTFRRISESFPDDTLADDALFEAGESYQRLWRRPDLDSDHGASALSVYQTLLAIYPGSPLRDSAEAAIRRLQEWFAIKEYETGYHYLRRRAYDSAIIYFRGVIENYPDAPKTREASLRLLEAYRAIRYGEDARELCAVILNRYPADREVASACSGLG